MMAQLRDLVRHIRVVTAGKARKCSHNKAKHPILKGERLIEVNEGLYKGETPYCHKCALEMLQEAKTKITALEVDLTKS